MCSGAHSGKFWWIFTRQLFAIYSTPEGVTRDPTDWETQTSFEKFNYLVLGQKRWNSKSLSCMKIKQQWHFCKNIPASANQLRKKKGYFISNKWRVNKKINQEEKPLKISIYRFLRNKVSELRGGEWSDLYCQFDSNSNVRHIKQVCP